MFAANGLDERPDCHVAIRSERGRLRELRSPSFLATHGHGLSQPLITISCHFNQLWGIGSVFDMQNNEM